MNHDRRVSRHAPLVLSLCAALVGCDQGKRAAPPPGPGGMPPSANAEATDKAAQVHPSETGALPAGHPAMPAGHPPVLAGNSPGSAAAPPSMEAAPPSAASAKPAEAKISGVLKLSDKVKSKLPAGTTIFLMARTPAPGGGPGGLVAVKKLEVGKWPLPFELSDSDVMIQGTPLTGQMVLSARIDQDGDAMTKAVGDVEGTGKPLTLPARGVELVLDTVRTAATGTPLNLGGPGGPMGGPGGPMGGMPAGHP